MVQLNGKYSVFGKVVNGMNTVFALQRADRILSASVGNGDGGGGGGESARREDPQGYQGGPAPRPVDSGF